MSETWRDYMGGLYRVSSRGRVWSKRLRRLLRPCVGGPGYEVLTLCPVDAPKATYTVHRMVAEAFLGPCPEGMEVNHINGVKTDNSVGNLEYVTPSENVRHAYRTGLNYTPGLKGEAHPSAKLTDSAVRAIRRQREGGANISQLSRAFGVDRAMVRRIVRREAWSHVA